VRDVQADGVTLEAVVASTKDQKGELKVLRTSPRRHQPNEKSEAPRLLAQHFFNAHCRKDTFTVTNEGGFVGGIESSEGVRSKGAELEFELAAYDRA
jgi:hypothetical protein